MYKQQGVFFKYHPYTVRPAGSRKAAGRCGKTNQSEGEGESPGGQKRMTKGAFA